jgi:hypothetical protein
MYLIQEVTSVTTPQLLKESKEDGHWKIFFKAILQTCDEENRNKRIYPRQDLAEALNAIQDRVRQRAFLGELDHPAQSNEMSRQATVLFKEASHLFTKIWFQGNEVWGQGETLATPNGQILTALIKDRVPIGFSLRALGQIQESANGAKIVRKPIFVVAYDAVSRPSHERALIKEVVSESVFCVDGMCGVANEDALQDMRYVVVLQKELKQLRKLR